MSTHATRIACVVVPNFAIAALYRVEPALREIPVALTDGPGPRAAIVAVSDTAARLGVRTGLTATQGTAICTTLTLRPMPGARPQPATTGEPSAPPPAGVADYRRAAQAALCEVAVSCSPHIEDPHDDSGAGHGLVYLDARGAPFPSEHALGAALTARAAHVGLEARVGIASTKTTARLAALTGAGVTVVSPGTERRFLAPLPIGLLEPDPERAATLIRWGITRIGQLACLSPAASGRRLGALGARLVRRARGEDDSPLVPRPMPLAFEEEIDLDYDIDTLEPLAFVLRGCLDRLLARLELRSLACDELRLSLRLATRGWEERTVAVAAPTTDVKVLLTLARLHLETHPPAAPVEAIRAAARPAHVRAAQLDLYRPAGPAPERLATTLARLTAICGSGRVGQPAVVNSHRPEAIALVPFDPTTTVTARRDPRPGATTTPSAAAFTSSSSSTSPNPSPPSLLSSSTSSPPSSPPSPAAASPTGSCRLALRAIRPPRPVEVFDTRGEPDFVRGEGFGGRVVALAGPWRLAGEWWAAGGFTRDYYDVSLSDGGVYRVYRDRRSATWFVEGEYD
jgi:protein ImuB